MSYNGHGSSIHLPSHPFSLKGQWVSCSGMPSDSMGSDSTASSTERPKSSRHLELHGIVVNRFPSVV